MGGADQHPRPDRGRLTDARLLSRPYVRPPSRHASPSRRLAPNVCPYPENQGLKLEFGVGMTPIDDGLEEKTED